MRIAKAVGLFLVILLLCTPAHLMGYLFAAVRSGFRRGLIDWGEHMDLLEELQSRRKG